jgi:catechol-2,3-dioxygenase
VDDLAAIVERCAGAGYPVTSDESLPEYERVYVEDPFGNRIELLQVRLEIGC